MHPLPSPVANLALPKPGARLDLPPLAGASDALWLAHLAQPGRLTVVVTANPLDAQRLQDEAHWFAPQLAVRVLPDWETLPYDSFSPHEDLVSERLATLYDMQRGACQLVLVPASTALYRMAPPEYLAAYTFFLKQGDELDAEALRTQMTLAGYAHVTQVVSPGEYSVRGGLIDLFPMGSAVPYRIDLLDDEIESLKTFDVDTQRTIYPVSEIRLLPAREFALDDKARTRFRQRFREEFEGDPSRSTIYKDVSNGIAPAGIEYWLPLFHEQTATLFDYLQPDTLVCLHHDVAAAIGEFWRDLKSRFDLLKSDRARPLLAPAQMFLDEERFFVRLQDFARVNLSARATPPTRPRCRLPTSRSTARRAIRWPGCAASARRSKAACCCWPSLPAGARRFTITCGNTGCRPRRWPISPPSQTRRQRSG